eukprot:Selendium_serpulae@DN11611_c0_g1_i1.p1
MKRAQASGVLVKLPRVKIMDFKGCAIVDVMSSCLANLLFVHSVNTHSEPLFVFTEIWIGVLSTFLDPHDCISIKRMYVANAVVPPLDDRQPSFPWLRASLPTL